MDSTQVGDGIRYTRQANDLAGSFGKQHRSKDSESCSSDEHRDKSLCSDLAVDLGMSSGKTPIEEGEKMSISTAPRSANIVDRNARLAWIFFAGTIVAVVLSGIWSMIVGTASPGADESDLIQGWEGVLRNLPGYLLPVLVASSSVWFATRAGSLGPERGRAALIASSLVLLFALSSVTRDAAEVVMTTRAATVSWLTFGVDAVITGSVYLVARRRIRSASGRGTIPHR